MWFSAKSLRISLLNSITFFIVKARWGSGGGGGRCSSIVATLLDHVYLTTLWSEPEWKCGHHNICFNLKVCIDPVYADSSGVLMIPVGKMVPLGSFLFSGLVSAHCPEILESQLIQEVLDIFRIPLF
jgi:hypothetical protein